MTHDTRAKQYQKYGEGSHMLLPLFVHPDIFPVKRGADRGELQHVVLGQCPAIKPPLSSFSPRSFRVLVFGMREALKFRKQPCSPTQLQNSDVGLRTRAFQNETSALALGGGIAAGSKTTRNKLPRSPLLTSSMCPPFASTAQRAMARPSPTPPSSLERPASTR